MQVFTDKKGGNWTVVIDVAAVRRVNAMLEIDLMTAIEGGFMGKLSAAPTLACNILFVLCEKEALARGVSDRRFGKLLGGGCMLQAYCAFITELVNFFPEGGKKETAHSTGSGQANRKNGESEKNCTAKDCWELVWNHAGVLGVDPSAFTLRDLCLMATYKKRDDWNHTAALLTQNFNMNRAKDQRPRSPDFFNPYTETTDKSEGKIKVDKKTGFGMLKKIFVRKK